MKDTGKLLLITGIFEKNTVKVFGAGQDRWAVPDDHSLPELSDGPEGRDRISGRTLS